MLPCRFLCKAEHFCFSLSNHLQSGFRSDIIMIQDILANHQKGCREIRMEFSINMGQWNAVFAVPAAVVDEHMKLAGAAQLKVLLYLLRHAGQPVTLEQLSFAVGQKPADTQDAVDYTKRRHGGGRRASSLPRLFRTRAGHRAGRTGAGQTGTIPCGNDSCRLHRQRAGAKSSPQVQGQAPLSF